MSPAAALWTRVGVGTAASLAFLVALAPPHPATRVPWILAVGAGIGGGVVLYVALTGCRPRMPKRRQSMFVSVGIQAFLGLLATNEEIVWRRVVLGELLRVGGAAAFLGSTIGFALMHRSARRLQLGTGAAFGALYLFTGVLAACVAAHWVYNALVGSLVDDRRLDGSPPS